MNMYKLIRPFLWTMDAERAHDLALNALHRAGRGQTTVDTLRRLYCRPTPTLAVKAFGLTFSNCIGLAAGLDKNAVGLPALAALGFGFLEVGTVTPRPQAGNPRPRMWRLPQDRALINRLGFNNAGAEAVRANLAKDAPALRVPLGINIGKNAVTPLEEALDDYRACVQTLYPWADYIVINVSSPNTPGLRALQQTDALDELLAAVRVEVDKTVAQNDPSQPGRPTTAPPLLVKIAPDMGTVELDGIVESCLRHGVAGIIATNTTVTRTGVAGRVANETGGLSGAPLTGLSNSIVAALYRRVGNRLPIIGVGGIMNAADAYAKIKAGATLVQVLTGFVYEGPGFPGRLAGKLQQLLIRDGLRNVTEAVGVEAERYDEP